MKAKCIDDRFIEALTLGKIYEVENYGPDKEMYRVCNDKGNIVELLKSRFEIIEEAASPVTYGVACKICQSYNEYQPSNSNFICYGCRS